MGYSDSYSYSGGQPWGGFGNSQRAPYNPNYNRYGNSGVRSYRGSQQPRKRSGAKFGTDKNGNPYVSGWKKNRSGFYTLLATVYKGTKEREGTKVKSWLNLFVQITNRTTMEVRKYSGMLDVNGRKLYIKDLNQVATSKGSGGYWGIHINSRRNNRR